MNHFVLQEQPLLLEDLLEQEKREQARNIGSDVNNPQQSLFSDQVNLLTTSFLLK
jgi:hypothetical protein